MTASDFATQLRAEEQARLARGIPPSVRRSLNQRLEQELSGARQERQGRRPRTWALGFAGGFAVLLLVASAAWLLRPQELAAFRVAQKSGDFSAVVREDAALDVLRGSVALEDRASGISLDVRTPARVRKETGGVRVLRGTVEFAVKHRTAAQGPARVWVSGGAIEILGTRFTVDQGAAGGTVRLHEGKIRFRAVDGEEQVLLPGQTLAWPLPKPPPPHSQDEAALEPAPAAAPVASTVRPSKSARRAEAQSADALLREVDILRSRRQYEAAARLLRSNLERFAPATRERLSFELGSLLTRQLRDRPRACAHWASHAKAFAPGRYQSEIRGATELLRCDALGPGEGNQ